MSKMLYTRFTKLIISYFLSCNKSIPCRSNFELHSTQDDQPITKLSNTVKGDYNFGMEILDTVISDAIKKSAGYNYYIAKKKESAKDKIIDELEKQRVSPIKSRRRKGFMCYGDQAVNISKKDVMPRKTRSLTITEETVVSELAMLLQIRMLSGDRNLKVPQLMIQQFSLYTNSDAIPYSSCSDTTKESDNKTNDADDSDTDLSDDNPDIDDDATGFGNLLNETPANELMDFVSNLVYTDAQTTSAVIYPKANLELTSYISGSSEVPLAKAKKLMKKAKKNMRKINFKKAITQKFREYDQKLEALTNISVFEAFEKVVQAKVLTEIKKLLPTHISNAIENYVRPRLNTSVLQEEKNKGYQEDENVRNHPNPEWFPNKLGSDNAKRRTTWFDLLLKSDIDKNENHILGPSTVSIVKKLKELIQKDELTIVYLKGAGLERLKQQYKNDMELEYHVDQLKAVVLTEVKWNSDEDDVSKPRLFEQHMSKTTKPHPSFYNNDFYYLVSLSTEEKYTTSITKHYVARYHKQGMEEMISDRWYKETHCYLFEALNCHTPPRRKHEA
ncbi:hypothetical protein Tco_0583185 [Tanacetum coccineum]